MLELKSPNIMEEKSHYHYPVMRQEVLDGLQLKKIKYLVDCTAGMGGHAFRMLDETEDIFYLGIDKDSESLKEAYVELSPFKGRFVLVQDDFCNLDLVCDEMCLEKADAFFFDLGISSYQLASPGRGFSFLEESFLDMRLDQASFVTASDLINNLSERELADIFKKFGEERYSRRVAHALAFRRRSNPVLTTTQLVRIIEKCVPVKNRFGRVHPATRIFQALRIAVNRELESLETAIPKAVHLLAEGGRIAVISFHSLEDRIVKHTFKKLANQNILKIITKKPLVPTEIEKKINPASRPAKLRIAEKNKQR